MAKAAELLRDLELAIADVAERVGRAGEPAFNRAFTRLQGTGPGAYRRASRTARRATSAAQ